MFILATTANGKPEWIDDPSHLPTGKYDENLPLRVRLLADFNADGIQDLALSDVHSSLGVGGTNFILYLGNGKGKYRSHGNFVANLSCISLEKTPDKNIRLWTFRRLNGRMGYIGYNEVRDEGLSEYRSVIIHPGDGGTKLGNVIYEAVIKNSDLPIVDEVLQMTDGVAKWEGIEKLKNRK